CIKAANFSKNEVPTSIISVYKTYENYVAAMYYNAGVIYRNQNKRFDEVRIYQKILETTPDHSRTHLSLGFAYYSGEGISMNKYKAYEHWNIAAKQGDEGAQMALYLLCNESPWACK
ncbi:MAG: hypothetical protein RBR59_10195, partial [Sulfurimonadaceae bacterium]|nr:hypothetical protein [Sulfurimonadaceae bacterium]